MTTRGIRGATTVTANDRVQILTATDELLRLLVRLNGIRSEDVVSAVFSATADIDAEFPAVAAREMGWTEVPLLHSMEIPVPGALGLCIRVLVTWNTDKAQSEIRHAFLHGARVLRPAWAIDLPGDPPRPA